MRIAVTIILSAVFGLVGTAVGHHSDAGYDQERIIGFEGTVTRFLWRNPHITVFVETPNEDGELVEWGVETGSTPIMTRSGWSRDLFAPGDVISVRAHPDRQHRAHAMMISIEKSDGSVWIQDESDTQATASATSLDGVWKGIGATTGPFSRALDAMPLTPAGEAARASYNFQAESPIRNCIPPPPPGTTVASTVYLNEFEVLDDRVVIRSEFFDAERIVYLDGRGHPENGERTNLGHSIGHWEGDTLVVDTTLFAEHRSTNGTGVPSGPNKHIVERFSLSEDGTRMIVDVVLEDPDYLVGTFSATKELLYAPHLQLFRYDCDPELSRQAGFE
ncbi:MAG: hypothetical protein GWN29_09970 [Gammaproteobacteria bacterium]|nr:hypothetical protein [Gammaproteobacteria bacterium]